MIDLHCHTSCSDGTLEPRQLLQLAKTQGVRQLAITDHDTVSAYSQLEDITKDKQIELITGVEFSSHWHNQTIHIIGLNIDLQHPSLHAAVTHQSTVRLRRAMLIGAKLDQLGFGDAYTGALALAGNAVICRPHFARYLVQQGVVASESSAFKKYLGAGKIGDILSAWPGLETAVGWIIDCGGVPVLAHPMRYRMNRRKRMCLIRAFTDAGGLAMEVCCANQAPGIAEDLANICQHYNLYASVGSDFHSPDYRWIKLGHYPPLPKQCRPVWQLWR
mgnify:CR=1 FL=1